MSSTFTPTTRVEDAGEKEWGYQIGLLDWDNTSIVFTKRSLIEFLKHTGTTVDTNFNSIAKLPRYAKFGNLTSADGSTVAQAAPSTSSSNAGPTQGAYTVVTSDGNAFKPSRRVRDAPGGTTTDIFDNSDVNEEPRKHQPVSQITTDDVPQDFERKQPETVAVFSDAPKPSRRVRDMPGGQSSMGSLWGEGSEEEFKPTRRVREGPGGHDNINGLF